MYLTRYKKKVRKVLCRVEWIRRNCVRGNMASRCITPEFEPQLCQKEMPYGMGVVYLSVCMCHG